MDRISMITALFSRALVLKSIGGDSLKYIGVTTTALTDGATTNPITIDGDTVTATNGNVALYGGDAFVFNGTIWQSSSAISQIFTEIGDLSDLDTEAKTDLVSAINEVNEEKQDDVELSLTPTAVVSDRDIIDGQGNTLSVLAEALTKTASGNPVVISDCAGGKARSLITEINAIQDLHGYDKPWVGGAGKNLFNPTALTTTQDGVTFTNNGNGTYTLNGTATADTDFSIESFQIPVVGVQYRIVGCPTGVSPNAFLQIRGTSWLDEGIGITQTSTDTYTHSVQIRVRNGATFNNVVFKPMFSLDTTITYDDFEPYENICPISGRTAVAVERTSKNFYNINDLRKDGNVTYTVVNDTLTIVSSASRPKIYYTPSNIFSGQTVVFSFTIDSITNGGGAVFFGLVIRNSATSTVRYISASNCTTTGNKSVKATLTANEYIERIDFNVNDTATALSSDRTYVISNIQLEFGSTATAYVPYAHSSATIQLGTTVYGADINWDTGVMTVDRVKVSKTWGQMDNATDLGSGVTRKLCNKGSIGTLLPMSAESISNVCAYFGGGWNDPVIRWFHDETNAFFYLPSDTPNDLVCEWLAPLATPTTIQLTPTQLEMLKGYNRVSIESGTITLDYIAKAISGNDEEIAPLVGDKATKSYAVNDFIERNDGLYRVTASIASGASFTANNTVKMSIGEALTYLYNK